MQVDEPCTVYWAVYYDTAQFVASDLAVTHVTLGPSSQQVSGILACSCPKGLRSLPNSRCFRRCWRSPPNNTRAAWQAEAFSRLVLTAASNPQGIRHSLRLAFQCLCPIWTLPHSKDGLLIQAKDPSTDVIARVQPPCIGGLCEHTAYGLADDTPYRCVAGGLYAHLGHCQHLVVESHCLSRLGRVYVVAQDQSQNLQDSPVELPVRTITDSSAPRLLGTLINATGTSFQLAVALDSPGSIYYTVADRNGASTGRDWRRKLTQSLAPSVGAMRDIRLLAGFALAAVTCKLQDGNRRHAALSAM